jgi:D-glycero-D-manno-heptose 1,7-bisphosphate phosphatase
MPNKLIILDRDGVINRDRHTYIKHADEWQALPGSLEAIALFTQAGYKIAIATNQSGIEQGLYDEQALAAIHDKLRTQAKAHNGMVDSIFYCPHTDANQCRCRKPKTGLLEQISQHYQMDLQQIPFVGDSWRDLEAGLKMGCQPVLVRTGNGEKTLTCLGRNAARVWIHTDLLAFAKHFLAYKGDSRNHPERSS